MSFRLKTILGIALIEAILLSTLILNNLASLKQTNEERLLNLAQTTSKLFALNIKEPLISSDLDTLNILSDELLKESYVSYINITDNTNVTLIKKGEGIPIRLNQNYDTSIDKVKDGIFDTYAEINVAGINYGNLHLGISIKSYLDAIKTTRQHSFTIAAIGMSLVALFSFMLGDYLTRQLSRLNKGSQKIAEGELGYQIEVKGRDELAQTAAAFNQMSRKLKSQIMWHEAVLKTALDCIITLDRDGYVLEVNPAFEQLFHFKPEEIAGKQLHQLIRLGIFHTLGYSSFREILIKNGDWLSKRVETTATTKDGVLIPIEWVALSSIDEGTEFYTIFIRDITEQQKNERLKNEFVATVSHELRTPLTAIHGILKLMDGGILSNDTRLQHEMITTAQNNSERLLQIINDILDIQKIETGNMHFHFSPEYINEIIQTSLQEHHLLTSPERIHFTGNEATENIKVNIDRNRIQQVMANLISNAFKFSADDTCIDIRTEPRDNYVRVYVIDKGEGIVEEFKQRIFQKFSQADSSSSRLHPGTGLGLSICKMIIEKHYGSIDYNSEAGKGTEFFFDLPIFTQ